MECCMTFVPHRLPTSSPSRPKGGDGFTFIEILFSIIILGIGMIMIAGMLPVAIKQNADTRNDLTARIVSDSGYAYLRTMAQTHPESFPETTGRRSADNLEPFPPRNGSELDRFLDDRAMGLAGDDYSQTSPALPASEPKAGRMMPLSFDVVRPDTTTNYTLTTANALAYPLLWHQLNLGDRVVSSEPRFQWLGFYRRDEGSNTVKLIVVAMRQQNIDRYRASDEDPARRGTATDRSTMPHESINALNGPFLVPIEIEDSLTEADKVKFVGTPGNNAWDIDVAEAGSYLIIAHSPPVSGNANGDLQRPYRNNGRVFRLAARRDDLDPADASYRVWELAPGFDLAPASEGPDGIFGTADDVPDGSMNTTASFAENRTPIAIGTRQQDVARYPLGAGATAAGTRTWAWLIGRGRLDPSAPGASPFTGATQDMGVLRVDMTLP